MELLRNTYMHQRSKPIIRRVMKEIPSIDSKALLKHVAFLISVVLVGALVLSDLVLSGTTNVPIHTEGGILYSREVVNATSGSVEDIQAAVNVVVAAGGGTVHVPEGTFTFEPRDSGLKDSRGRPVGVKFKVPAAGLSILGAGKNQTILQMPLDDGAPSGTMFQATGGYETSRTIGGWVSGGKLRISGITFRGRPNMDTAANSDTALYIESCKDFRVDHSAFYWMGDSAVYIEDHYTQSGIYAPNNDYVHYSGGDPARVSQGVIDHSDFIDLYKPLIGTNGYGVAVGRAMHYLWTPWDDDIWNVLGVYDKNVFIEDCYFRGVRHAVAASNGGVYVLRNSIIEDLRVAEAATTGHPNRENYHGMRAHEIYSNIIRYTGSYGFRFYGVHMEGGGGVVFSNTIDNLIHAFRFGSCEVTDPDYHPRGHLNDIYVWGNSVTRCDVKYFAFSNAPTGCPQPTEGVEYFVDADAQSRVETAGYQPYPYPHPLTL